MEPLHKEINFFITQQLTPDSAAKMIKSALPMFSIFGKMKSPVNI